MNSVTYKPSYYNFYIPVPEKDCYLLYNSRTNGLVEMKPEEARQLIRWSKLDEIPSGELRGFGQEAVDSLIEFSFIVSSRLDEKELIHKRIVGQRQASYRNATFELTITPTLSCNMGCPYCFEGPKPYRNFMSEETVDDIVQFMEREIQHSRIVESFGKIRVTWYGGEPLLRPEVIEHLSSKILVLQEKYELEYEANCVTNGLLLTPENWAILERAKVSFVQVTIDGYKDTHDTLRPLLPMYGSDDQRNYDKILDHLSALSQSAPISVAIRINCDKNIMKHIDLFFDDLETRGIWPQRRGQFSMYLAHKTLPPDGSPVDEISDYYSSREFGKQVDQFSLLMQNRYNRWAEKNKKRRGRVRMNLPRPAAFLCGSASLPYSIVLDSAGYVHQCWEHVNHNTTRAHHISEPYDLQHPRRSLFVHWDKFMQNPMCRDCKILPICNMACPHLDPPDACPDIRWSLPDRLKSQYLMTKDAPEQIQSFEEFDSGLQDAYSISVKCDEIN